MVSLIETPTRLLVTGTPDEMSELKQQFRYHPKDYFRSDAYQLWKLTGGERGWDGYRYPLQLKTPLAGEILRGRKREVLTLCQQFGFQVNQDRCLKSPFANLKITDIPDDLIKAEFVLDANQKQAIVEWLRNGMGVIHAAVNFGKTAMLAAAVSFVKRKFPEARFLYFTFTERLVKQVMESMQAFLPDWHITQYGGGGKRDLTGKDMIVATQAILNRNFRELERQGLFTSFHGLLLDESHHCFPAGTLVDGKPIETYRKGDKVWSINAAGSLCQSAIVPQKRLLSGNLYRIRTVHLELICTGDHPIYVQGSGYVPARYLSVGTLLVSYAPERRDTHEKISARTRLRVQSVPKTVCSQLVSSRCRHVLFSRVPVNFQKNECTFNYWPMCLVPGQVCLRQPEQPGQGLSGKACLLFKNLFKGSPAATVIRTDDKNQSQVRFCAVCTHESKQSNAFTRDESKGEFHFTSNGLETNSTWGKWTTHSASDATGTCFRLGNGSGCANRLKAKRWFSGLLQNRCGSTRLEDCCRSGWLWAHNSFNQGARRQEDRFFRIERVESIEVLEQSGDKEFERLCPGGVVYNLEVENTHNYFANSILVHNCSSPSAMRVITACCAYFRWAASDSIKKDDPVKFNNISGMCGPVLWTVTSSTLIEQSRSAAPQLYLVDIPEWRGKFRGLEHDPQPGSVAWTLMENQWIQGIYRGPVPELDEQGKPKMKAQRRLEGDQWVTDRVPVTEPALHLVAFSGVAVKVPARFTLLDRRYDRAVIRFKERNALICEWAKYYSEKDWRTVIVATRTTHVLVLEALLSPLLPGKIRMLTGEDSTSQRNEVFAWINQTPGCVLISPLLKEGVNLPLLKAGIIADVIADYELAKQVIGRFMRKKEDNRCHITWFRDSQHSRYDKNFSDVFNRLEKIEGFTFYWPVAGPATIAQANVYKGQL